MKLTNRQRTIMVIVLLLGSFTTAFSETLLNNGLPTIMREVHVDEMTVQWLSTGYMLAAGITMPLAAFLIKSIRLKTLFTSTMTIFLTGTVMALLAPNFPVLLIGRLIEGVAVGVNMPLIPSVLSLIYPMNRRGTVMGLAGIIVNLGPALGPTISGIIVDYYSWRMLFIILVPIAVVIIIATQLWVKNVVETAPNDLDMVSVIAATLGLGMLLYGLGRIGQTGRMGIATVILLVAGALITAFFVRRQLQLEHPLLEMKIYQAPSFRLGALLALINTSSLMATELMLPLFNQNVLRVTPMVSGLMLIPSAVVMAVMSPLAGRIYDLVGIKKVALVGMGLGLLFTVPMIFYRGQTGPGTVLTMYALRCGALQLAYSPVMVYALNSLSKQYVVFGSTLIINMNQIADAFANAVAMTIQSLGHQAGLHAGLTALPALTRGYQWSFAAICLLNMIGFLLVFKLKNRSQIEFGGEDNEI